MTDASTNPKVAAIRGSVQESCAAIVQLIEEPLAKLDPLQLYVTPAKDEWSIMQNLAHILEFMPYWGSEIAKLVAHPGQNFGRTMQHEGRLRFIEEHQRDTIPQILTAFPASQAQLEAVLDTLSDSDLALTGHHPKFGEQTLEWFINEFVCQHLKDHVEQLKTCIAEVR